MDAPWPLIEIAIEPTSRADAARLAAALAALAVEDPSFHVKIDTESGQIILGGTSELHLDLMISRLREAHGIVVVCGGPQVAYRETLTPRVEQDYTHKKQTAGTGQFARVKIVFEPDAEAHGTTFVVAVVGGAVPAPFIEGVATGIASVAAAGVLAGFPVIGVKATLIDGAYHDTDSSSLAFEIAARHAFREALRASVLLEPIMQIEVVAPDMYAGALLGDLRARGRVHDHGLRDGAYVVIGLASLANLFGYESQLRSLTQGHGTFTMHFHSYEPFGRAAADGRRPLRRWLCGPDDRARGPRRRDPRKSNPSSERAP